MHITEKKTHRLSRRPTSNEQEVLFIKLLLVCMSNDLYGLVCFRLLSRLATVGHQ